MSETTPESYIQGFIAEILKKHPNYFERVEQIKSGLEAADPTFGEDVTVCIAAFGALADRLHELDFYGPGQEITRVVLGPYPEGNEETKDMFSLYTVLRDGTRIDSSAVNAAVELAELSCSLVAPRITISYMYQYESEMEKFEAEHPRQEDWIEIVPNSFN